MKVRGAFEKGLDENEIIDEESKVVFKEALDNFEDSRYRSVTRVLSPEIERVSRRLGHSRLRQAMQVLVDDAPIDVISSWLESSFLDHLRETKVGELGLTSNVEPIATVSDGIPNRHAVAHGTSYPNRKDALNNLFIVDHVFSIVGERFVFVDA